MILLSVLAALTTTVTGVELSSTCMVVPSSEVPPSSLQNPISSTDKQTGPPLRVLIFSLTRGYRHESIPTALEAMKKAADQYKFVATLTEDPNLFSEKNLGVFDVVIFMLTTGDVLNAEQEKAFEKFIRAGGGFVGIHSATDTEYDWNWYAKLVGAQFKSHPRVQSAQVRIEDKNHPTTKSLPETWRRSDEWYDFRANPRSSVRVLATVDESTYEGGGMGGDHPIIWCHEFDGGRSWYTAMGHTNESYGEPLFIEMIVEAIRWAGKRAGEAPNSSRAVTNVALAP